MRSGQVVSAASVAISLALNIGCTSQIVPADEAKAGAKIELTRERDLLVVDRVWLVGSTGGDLCEMKSTLKEVSMSKASASTLDV